MFARKDRIIYVNEYVYVQKGVCKTLGHVKYSDNNGDSRLVHSSEIFQLFKINLS